MKRLDGRARDELRPIEMDLGFVENPTGSCLIRMGRTMVLCTVHLAEQVPGWLRGRGSGWVTAEYSLLPGSTDTRSDREAVRGRLSGRTMEIQRLIGRSLRAVTDLEALGERALLVDCDVLQADGGTRTAAITGAYVALAAACRRLRESDLITRDPLRDSVAAISVGIVNGAVLLDLPYEEDARADVDLNLVRTGGNQFVEIQGTGESATFDQAQLDAMLELGAKGIAELTRLQQKVLSGMRRLLLATRNEGKARELREFLAGLDVPIESLASHPEAPDVEEAGGSFEANARLKATQAATSTGIWSIAEDSGLVVDKLGGEPGVYSARYAGVHGDVAANNAKLLRELEGEPQRSARFICVMALARPDGEIVAIGHGTCEGAIAEQPRGRDGFGYDPIFVPERAPNCTMAELEPHEKGHISHRGQAMRSFLPLLRVHLDDDA